MTTTETTLDLTDTIWNDKSLESMRSVGDPLADALIEKGMAAGNLKQVSTVMRQMITNRDPIPAELSPDVQSYFTQTRALPEGIDWERIELAQKIYSLYSLEIGFLLMYASLPACYAAEKGAQVLILTERMAKQNQAYNRIFETGQFVFDVMSPGGFKSTGRAICSAQKVRLVHAVVRHHILAKRDEIWNEDWGIPVNQEDQLGTLFAFSVAVIKGLDKIGVFLTDYEKESFYHLWWVVGHLLGIDPQAIPADLQTAFAVSDAIEARHFGPSEAGQALTRTILDMLEETAVSARFKKMPHAIMRYCLGEEIGDMLGIDKPERWLETLVQIRFGVLELADGMRYSPRFVERTLGRAGRELVGRMGYSFLSGMTTLQQAGQGTQFELPSRLQNNRRFGPITTSILQAGTAAIDRQMQRFSQPGS